MTMQRCNRLHARFWFRWREPVNWVISIGLFVVVFQVLAAFFGVHFAAAISIAAVFCLFFFVLKGRAIGIRCPRCTKPIDTNTPWICGYKQCRNENVDDYPFVHRCQHCGAEPKAYECHHCQELIFFTEDCLRINYAKCINLPAKPKALTTDGDVEEIDSLDKGIQISERKLKKAKIDVELKTFDEILNPPKPKKQRDILQEDFENYHDRNMSGADIVQSKKAENAVKYQDDPAELERQNALVDLWAQNNFDKL
jgi:hypothetical protein